MNGAIRNTGAEGMLEILCYGLERDAKQRTANRSGDRSRYVGLSDIAKMLGCPRAALAAKLCLSEYKNAGEALKYQLLFQRGRWFETGIHQALMRYVFSPLSQLEIEVSREGVPVKAHLNSTPISTQPQPTVRILEVKSIVKLPVTFSESYAMQIGGQTALLKAYRSLPVFNFVQDTGEILHHRTFLEICNECLGVPLLDAPACNIQGWVLRPSMCDAKASSPFLPENMDFVRCLNMASEFWEVTNDLKENRLNLNTIQTAQEPAPPRPSCFWKEDCPRFKGSFHPEWDAAFVQLMDSKVQKKPLDEAIGESEARLKVVYQLSRTVRGEWINTGSHTLRVISQSGKVTLDRKRLAEGLKNLLGGQKAQTLMARYEKPGEPFGRLYAVQTANEF